ncbi:Protein kinase-like domain [Pseudocohnilembus persalinus]|uniref:Protein kinase-like domain n=1 Tax=Pseudocohnilembus persalinus TaxID=266149 RepID=A0A0V0QYQ0_PSEPJ|nr:Protein kinase-like domain [Pseudocohnilembus persalinus]|eukprot:KRX07152.1 Protein kinase-like domain [Pseudocohnilembus persalinus]
MPKLLLGGGQKQTKNQIQVENQDNLNKNNVNKVVPHDFDIEEENDNTPKTLLNIMNTNNSNHNNLNIHQIQNNIQTPFSLKGQKAEQNKICNTDINSNLFNEIMEENEQQVQQYSPKNLEFKNQNNSNNLIQLKQCNNFTNINNKLMKSKISDSSQSESFYSSTSALKEYQSIIHVNNNQDEHIKAGIPKKSKTYQTICSMGSGNFGLVHQIIDFKSQQLYARKKFFKYSAYDQEKKTYAKIKNDFADKNLEKFGILVQENLRDLKCSNIVLDAYNSQYLQIKVIDFAGCTNEWQGQDHMTTPLFFNSYKRKEYYPKIGSFAPYPKFQSVEERFKNEIFSVVRTFQQLCINSGQFETYIHAFRLEDHPQKPQTKYISYDQLTTIMTGIKYQIFPEYYMQDQDLVENRDFKEIIDFIQNKLITEEYTEEDIEQFVNDINQKKEELNKYIGIQDSQKVSLQIFNEKIEQQSSNNQQNKETYSSIEKLFQLKCYLPGTECTKKDDQNDQSLDLFEEVSAFIQENNKQVAVLLGDSGQGKSSFLNYLENKYDYPKNWKLIKLSQFFDYDSLSSYVNQILSESVGQQYGEVKYISDDKKITDQFSLYNEFLDQWGRKKIERLQPEEFHEICFFYNELFGLDQKDEVEPEYVQTESSYLQNLQAKQNKEFQVQQCLEVLQIFNTTLSYYLLKLNSQYFDIDIIQKIFKISNDQNKKICEILVKCSPFVRNNQQYTYIHKSIQEFYQASYFLRAFDDIMSQFEIYHQQFPDHEHIIQSKKQELKHYYIYSLFNYKLKNEIETKQHIQKRLIIYDLLEFDLYENLIFFYMTTIKNIDNDVLTIDYSLNIVNCQGFSLLDLRLDEVSVENYFFLKQEDLNLQNFEDLMKKFNQIENISTLNLLIPDLKYNDSENLNANKINLKIIDILQSLGLKKELKKNVKNLNINVQCCQFESDIQILLQKIENFKQLQTVKLNFLDNVFGQEGANQVYNNLKKWEMKNYESNGLQCQFTNQYDFIYHQPENENDEIELMQVLEQLYTRSSNNQCLRR